MTTCSICGVKTYPDNMVECADCLSIVCLDCSADFPHHDPPFSLCESCYFEDDEDDDFEDWDEEYNDDDDYDDDYDDDWDEDYVEEWEDENLMPFEDLYEYDYENDKWEAIL